MEKYVITVSYGMYQVFNANNKDGKGVHIKTLDNVGVLSLPNAYWWDKDTITAELEGNQAKVIETENKKR